MKKFMFLIPIILLFSCKPFIDPIPSPTPSPTVINTPQPSPSPIPSPILLAEVTITNIYQEYYETLDEYEYVEIYFNIKNTGTANIQYYKLFFEVICKDGTIYEDWTNGLSLNIGSTRSDWIPIETYGKQYNSVRFIRMELMGY